MSSPDLLALQREGTRIDDLHPSRSASSSGDLRNVRQLSHRSPRDSSRRKRSKSRSSNRRTLSVEESKSIPRSSHSRTTRDSSRRARSRSRQRDRGASSKRRSSRSSSRHDTRTSERSRQSIGRKTSSSRRSSSRSRRHSSDRRSSSRGDRRNSADRASRTDRRRERRSDPLSSRSSHASLGGGSSPRRSPSQSRRSKGNKPFRRYNSMDNTVVLSEDEEKHPHSDDDCRLGVTLWRPEKKRDVVESPVIQSTLSGDDSDAKAKAKASRDSGVDRIFSPSSSSVWEKAKSSRGSLERTLGPSASTNSTATSTLYGSDADAKAKAKAKASNAKSPIASNPGVESVSNGSSHTAATLYGRDADAKAKAKASRGDYSEITTASNAAASVGTTSNATYALNGRDADANAKARSAYVGSTVAANSGVESISLPAVLTECVDINDTMEQPGLFAKRVSIGSTDSESGSKDAESGSDSVSNPKYKSANRPQEAQPETMDISFQMPNEKTKERNDEKEKRSKKRRIPLVLLFFLFVIGAAIAVWFFLFRNDGDNQDSRISSSNLQDPTKAPSSSVAPSGLSVVWSTSPTTSPFFEGLLYQPPSKANCDAIARNETIAGREYMEDADFGVGLDVVLSGSNAMTEPLVNQLLDAIQEKIMPSLVGCNIIVDEFVDDWRFVIFDAFVTGNVESGEGCKDESFATQNCHPVSVQLDLFLKGRVRFLDLIGLISAEEENISNHLGLPEPFSIVKLNRQIDNLTPTASPSTMPSNVPSATPSENPTAKTGANPTFLPTGTPTKFVAGVPTRSPSSKPSLAPSAVPTTILPAANPSFAPTGLSLTSPTARPSETPSAAPSLLTTKAPNSTPTVSPSTRPSSRPSNVPSNRPSGVPSESPSTIPSVPPSTSPSSAPSSTPSTSPSTSPSISPSRLPSTTPSDLPSVTSFYWVACGEVGKCQDYPARVQYVDYMFIDGITSDDKENMIAVQCCSEIELPFFDEPRESFCPYALSKFDNDFCYDTATYYEAESLCNSVAARLCTLEELENDCTKNLGCGHDDRMVWTSTPGP